MNSPVQIQFVASHASDLVQVKCKSWNRTSLTETRHTTSSPKFETFIFLEGEQSFWLDGTFFHIDAGHGTETRPKALTYVLTRETEVVMLKGGNSPLRKVAITSPLTWRERLSPAAQDLTNGVSTFLSTHLNHLLWEPEADVLAVCSHIEHPPQWVSAATRELYMAARGMDLLLAVCDQIGRDRDEKAATACCRKIHDRMDGIRSYLIEHLDEDVPVGQIARKLGLSLRSLQRHFRETFAESVTDCVRNARLDRARDQLSSGTLSIKEAAALAHYNNVGSFSSAFRKRYGMPPSFHASRQP